MPPAPDKQDFLAMTDEQLLAQCQVNFTRSSGPGGQHRNKVSSAVRLFHPPTGVSAHGDESRSQHDNKRQAVARLRMKIACQLRRPVALMPAGAASPTFDAAQPGRVRLPEVVAACLFVPRYKGAPPKSPVVKRRPSKRLQVGVKDQRFWPVAQFLLDVLEACQGRLAEAAERLEISTSNFATVLQQDRHLHAAAGEIRKRFGLGTVK
jgi:hypothetical protein